MKFFKYLVLAFIIAFPVNVFAGAVLPSIPVSSRLDLLTNHDPDNEVASYYDLRDRKTYIQITRDDEDLSNLELCIHVQIFQQDLGCEEVNFEDKLTIKDTVVYDLDNLKRNDGSNLPINLPDDSYGYVAISTFECGDRSEEPGSLIGNVRIIDDSGYEYRMNVLTTEDDVVLLEAANTTDGVEVDSEIARAHITIPFDILNGNNQADIVGFVFNDDRDLTGSEQDEEVEDRVFNEVDGPIFEVFAIDEHENRISCGVKQFACGPDRIMNYGINPDIPASRGNNLLCNTAELDTGQTFGNISLEGVSFISSIADILNATGELSDGFSFGCLVGLNNGNGTGSMDVCQAHCLFDDDTDCGD